VELTEISALAFEELTTPHVHYYFSSFIVRFLSAMFPSRCVRCTYARSHFYRIVRSYVRSSLLIIRSVSRSVPPFWASFRVCFFISRDLRRPFPSAGSPATVLGFNYLTYFCWSPLLRRPTICLSFCASLCSKYFGPNTTILSLSLFLHSPSVSRAS